MFNFLKHKEDPYTYRMLCKKCDVSFERENPKERECPACHMSNRVETYSLINKKTGRETR